MELEELADRQKKLFQLQASEAVVKKFRKEIDDLERKASDLTTGVDGVEELKRKMKTVRHVVRMHDERTTLVRCPCCGRRQR